MIIDVSKRVYEIADLEKQYLNASGNIEKFEILLKLKKVYSLNSAVKKNTNQFNEYTLEKFNIPWQEIKNYSRMKKKELSSEMMSLFDNGEFSSEQILIASRANITNHCDICGEKKQGHLFEYKDDLNRGIHRCLECVSKGKTDPEHWRPDRKHRTMYNERISKSKKDKRSLNKEYDHIPGFNDLLKQCKEIPENTNPQKIRIAYELSELLGEHDNFIGKSFRDVVYPEITKLTGVKNHNLREYNTLVRKNNQTLLDQFLNGECSLREASRAQSCDLVYKSDLSNFIEEFQSTRKIDTKPVSEVVRILNNLQQHIETHMASIVPLWELLDKNERSLIKDKFYWLRRQIKESNLKGVKKRGNKKEKED